MRQTWKNRREAIFTETQKIYEEKIRSNHLLTSHVIEDLERRDIVEKCYFTHLVMTARTWL